MAGMTRKQGRDERRREVRFDRSVELLCYVDGQRFDARSVNFSIGGLFLQTEDDIANGKVVLVTTREQKGRRGPIMIAGAVARRQEKPEKGLGLRFIKCICLDGPELLHRFLSETAGVVASQLPPIPKDANEAAPIGYSFLKRKYFSPGALIGGLGGREEADEPPPAPASAAGPKPPDPAPPTTPAAEPPRELSTSAPPSAPRECSSPTAQTRGGAAPPNPAPAPTAPANEPESPSATPDSVGEAPDYHRSPEHGPVSDLLGRHAGRVRVNYAADLLTPEGISKGTVSPSPFRS